MGFVLWAYGKNICGLGSFMLLRLGSSVVERQPCKLLAAGSTPARGSNPTAFYVMCSPRVEFSDIGENRVTQLIVLNARQVCGIVSDVRCSFLTEEKVKRDASR